MSAKQTRFSSTWHTFGGHIHCVRTHKQPASQPTKKDYSQTGCSRCQEIRKTKTISIGTVPINWWPIFFGVDSKLSKHLAIVLEKEKSYLDHLIFRPLLLQKGMRHLVEEDQPADHHCWHILHVCMNVSVYHTYDIRVHVNLGTYTTTEKKWHIY